MSVFSAIRPAEPFFLKVDDGQRFCLFHEPYPPARCRGTILYVHPFGDEMNKSRRMAALQARALAASGVGVLQIDLFGCGDSSGDFGDARWDIWKEDLAFARKWLESRAGGPFSLWGLRLGALLALDFARSQGNTIDWIILWQPVINGETFLNQFLRLQLANEILINAGQKRKTGTAELRQQLGMEQSLEIAGYEISPALAQAIDSMKAAELSPDTGNVHWFEIIAEPDRPMSSAGAKAVEQWKENGIQPHVHLVPGLFFWATQEIAECPELISATLSALGGKI